MITLPMLDCATVFDAWEESSGISQLIGFMGLGIDATIWYMAKRQIQTAVDAGAIARAHTLAKGGSVG